ncbi:MAG: hypothetical protein KIS66_09955 [Fimbriimonadaceae bacterium]|nr:hypothetical protein [Fimbriimonadaceae bacterium]
MAQARVAGPPELSQTLITIHLTKLETALEQVRKSHPKLNPTDQAMLANALVLAGRHAIALHDSRGFVWPDEYKEFTDSLVGEVIRVQEQLEDGKKVTKRVAKSADVEEPIPLTIDLKPNYEAGESLLESRDDLKAVFSDAMQEGVEYAYAGNDIGWQWALDRANWLTLSDEKVTRKVKVKVRFAEGATGSELGGATKAKARKR